jgi:hypothetical protein
MDGQATCTNVGKALQYWPKSPLRGGGGRRQWYQGSFFRLHVARKHPKKKFLLQKEAKSWMKKPKLDENRIKIGENFILHP